MTPSASETAEPHPLALLSHELRTPLTALIGYADAWRGEAFGPLNSPYREQAAIVHAAALHLLALVDTLSGTADAESGLWLIAPESIDLEAWARETVALFAPRAASAGVSLNLDARAAPAPFRADRRALGQILINLLDNALRHAGPGGRVAVTLTDDQGALRLEVTNSQSGTPTSGRGLGLRLVEGLCDAAGGAFCLTPHEGDMAAVARLPSHTEA